MTAYTVFPIELKNIHTKEEFANLILKTIQQDILSNFYGKNIFYNKNCQELKGIIMLGHDTHEMAERGDMIIFEVNDITTFPFEYIMSCYQMYENKDSGVGIFSFYECCSGDSCYMESQE